MHQSPRPGHTSLGGRGLLPKRWFLLQKGLRGVAVPKARAHQPGGTGSPAQAVVAAQGGPPGGSSPPGPGTLGWGDGKSCPSGGRCSRRAYEGQQSPWLGHTSLEGWGLLPRWWSVVHGACGGQQSPTPGHTSLRGRGALPRWWSVHKEGLRGAAVPKARAHQPGGTGSPAHAVVGAQGGSTRGSSSQGPGTRAWGDGDSCPSGGLCSRRACGGQRSPRPGHTSPGGRGVLPKRWSLLKEGLRGAAVPKARAHQPGGMGSPAQVVVGAQRGPTGGTSPQVPGTPARGDGEPCPGGGRCPKRDCGGQQSPRPGHTRLRGRGVLPKWWSLLKEGLRGATVPKARAHQAGGTGSPAQAVVAAQGGTAGGSRTQCPGTLAWGDGDSCPSGGRCSRRACGGQQSPTPGHTTLRGRGALPTW